MTVSDQTGFGSLGVRGERHARDRPLVFTTEPTLDMRSDSGGSVFAAPQARAGGGT